MPIRPPKNSGFTQNSLPSSMDHHTQTQKSPSSTTRYKGRIEGGGGVIPQPDGRRTNWASTAQIIYNHHQNWLAQDSVPQTYNRVASMLHYSNETNQQFSFMNTNYQQNEDGEEEEDEQTSAEVIEEDHQKQQHDEEEEEQHEHMFEKPLTPSDVGKLNRLVIPKQHAERYFPLSGDSSDKGLLLSFEDEAGKLWRFRYSYWNSSQSYVLTKGWSRYVKEKRLVAGDVVWFERRRFDAQRLFIRWRRRVVPVQDSRLPTQQYHHHHHHPNDAAAAAAAWTRVFYSAQQHHPYPSHHVHGPLLYQPDCLHAVEPVIEQPITKPVNSKRLRLFGVNLDCQLDEDEPPVPDISSQGQTHHFLYSQPDHYGSSHSNHKEFDFSPDVNQMRNG